MFLDCVLYHEKCFFTQLSCSYKLTGSSILKHIGAPLCLVLVRSFQDQSDPDMEILSFPCCSKIVTNHNKHGISKFWLLRSRLNCLAWGPFRSKFKKDVFVIKPTFYYMHHMCILSRLNMYHVAIKLILLGHKGHVKLAKVYFLLFWHFIQRLFRSANICSTNSPGHSKQKSIVFFIFHLLTLFV